MEFSILGEFLANFNYNRRDSVSHSLSFYCPKEKYSLVSTGSCQHPIGKVWREGETSPCD